nr:hypothetical protein [Desulforamulus aquiferis]
MPSQPAAVAIFSQPGRPSAICLDNTALVWVSLSLASRASGPPAWAWAGIKMLSMVLPAGYGYWSKAASKPSRRASSKRFNILPAWPQFSLPITLRCEICGATPVCLPRSNISWIDSSNKSRSLRT